MKGKDDQGYPFPLVSTIPTLLGKTKSSPVRRSDVESATLVAKAADWKSFDVNSSLGLAGVLSVGGTPDWKAPSMLPFEDIIHNLNAAVEKREQDKAKEVETREKRAQGALHDLS